MESALVDATGKILASHRHPTQTEVRERALKVAVEKMRVIKAALGNKAGIVGAAALAQDRIRISD